MSAIGRSLTEELNVVHRMQGGGGVWLLHARPRWSRQYHSMEPAKAVQWLARAFSARVGRAITPHHLAAHRWRYATPANPLPADSP